MKYRSDGKLVGSKHPDTHCADCRYRIKVGYKARCNWPEQGESKPIGYLGDDECMAFESLSGRQTGLGDFG